MSNPGGTDRGRPISLDKAGRAWKNRVMRGQDEHRADNSRRTPAWLIATAREVMGGIDLDPASDVEAQKTVGAQYWCGSGGTYITRAGGSACGPWLGTNGLAVPWHGRVWLNPPGGYMPDRSSSAAAWWTKLFQEYLSGRTEQALFLAFSLNVFRTGQDVRNKAPYEFPFLVFRERIRFPGSDGSEGAVPNVDSALVYLPPMTDTLEALGKFKAVFGQYGKVRI